MHGNHTTPDADVLALAGLTVGVVSDESLRKADEALRASGRFASVELRKRYRSIDNPLDILVIVVVDEHASVSATDLTPGPIKRIRSLGCGCRSSTTRTAMGSLMAPVSVSSTPSDRGAALLPFAWGGERKIAVEADRTFERGPISRVEGAVSITRRENPHFDLADRREQVRVRAERALTPWLRGGGARLTNVQFGAIEQRHFAPAVDVLVDTRTDPAFPRNAIHVVASAEQLRFAADHHVARWSGDARGYLGLDWFQRAGRPSGIHPLGDALPIYEQALLGGTSMLRGYEFGYRAGDNLAALSAEIRVPVTSPLNMGRLGVKAFLDAGTVYAAGSKISQQRFDRGLGAGVFVTATVLRAELDVAWPQTGDKKPRVHFGLGVTF